MNLRVIFNFLILSRIAKAKKESNQGIQILDDSYMYIVGCWFRWRTVVERTVRHVNWQVVSNGWMIARIAGESRTMVLTNTLNFRWNYGGSSSF